MPLLVMSYAQDKCSHAIRFLLCTLGLEVLYRKQGVCNNIRYRNLKQISMVPIFLLVISLFFKLRQARFSIMWSKLQFTEIFYANSRFLF